MIATTQSRHNATLGRPRRRGRPSYDAARTRYHSLRRTFGRTPGDVDDERFIAAWAETALSVARRYSIKERA
jgi:hypothetical protein